MKATAIEDKLWCEQCGEPHDFDEERGVHQIALGMPECYPEEEWPTGPMPDNWEREFILSYGQDNNSYVLQPKYAPPLECHHPMYFLTREKEK